MKRSKQLRTLPNNTVYDEMDSPVGCLTILASPQGLHSILWDIERHTETCISTLATLKHSANHPIILETKTQLTEYFLGKRKVFELPLVLSGTLFQTQVWKQLCQIPYGKTMSYAAQAEKMGNTNKARAVGLANGANPIPIVIPCHRVIGSNGQLTGFGGGIGKKRMLLQREQNKLENELSFK